MLNAYPNPSQVLPLHFKLKRAARLRFNLTENGVAANTTGWTWQLIIKRFPGDRLNLISLTLGYGLRYEIYSDTTLIADFTSSQTNLEEAEYYWQLIRTDLEKTFLEGPAYFTFAK